MIKLTQEQVKGIEEILNRNSYAIDYYLDALLAEDFEEIHKRKPDIVDAIRCVFVADGRYREEHEQTYFRIENSSKYGIDYSIYCKNCQDISKEEFKEIKSTTLSVLTELEDYYLKKEEV